MIVLLTWAHQRLSSANRDISDVKVRNSIWFHSQMEECWYSEHRVDMQTPIRLATSCRWLPTSPIASTVQKWAATATFRSTFLFLCSTAVVWASGGRKKNTVSVRPTVLNYPSIFPEQQGKTTKVTQNRLCTDRDFKPWKPVGPPEGQTNFHTLTSKTLLPCCLRRSGSRIAQSSVPLYKQNLSNRNCRWC